MLVNQGVESIRYWSGVTADAEVMRAAVLAVLPGLDAT
jgi:shikimate 5-dehydrogenase